MCGVLSVKTFSNKFSFVAVIFLLEIFRYSFDLFLSYSQTKFIFFKINFNIHFANLQGTNYFLFVTSGVIRKMLVHGNQNGVSTQ